MAKFGRFFAGRPRYDDLSEEMQQHLDEKAEAFVAGGMSPEDASRAARREFGNLTLLAERSREVWQWHWLERVWADTKLALRQLRRSPAFSTTAILTLALGIGANTGIFTLMHALLLQSLPIQEPDRLVRIALDVRSPVGAADDLPLNLFFLQSIERHAKSFSAVFGWSPYDFALRGETGLHVYSGAVVSGNAFQVLGVAPAAGRLLTPADDQRGGGPDGWAAVISHRFWQEHYHVSPSVIGKRITLADHSVTIVGVAPAGFEGVVVATHPDFYLPLEYEPVMRGAGSVLRLPGNVWLMTWARLKPGASMKSAAAEMHTLFRFAADETLPAAVRHAPVIERSTFAVRAGGKGWSSLRAQYAKPLFLLQGLVGVVLLICCVNLAGLCLARASTREHEFAIRGALGATRSRLIQEPLIESLLLALAGAAIAVLFALGIDHYLLQFLADRQAASSLSIRPNAMTLLATGGCAIACAALFGMAPAWLASHVSIEPALRRKKESLFTTRDRFSERFFVPAQIALTLVLIVVAAMLSATVINLRYTRLGFSTENVIFAPADFERLPQKGADLVHLYQSMISRIGQMPGVVNASVAENTPLGDNGQVGVFANSAASAENPVGPANRYSVDDVGADYFKAIGTRVVEGRAFTGNATDAATCMLNRSAAKRLFAGSPAIGLTVWQSSRSMNSGQSTDRECRVIGIVEDAKYTSLREEAAAMVYYPFGTGTDRLFSMYFVIHARSLAEARSAYHSVLHEFAPGTPETEPVAFSVQFHDAFARERLLSVLSGFFAVLALLLSSIGIYGLLAAHVTRRTTEIGVRLALGATRANILTLILSRAAMLMTGGVVAGVGLAWLATRSIEAFLFAVNPRNPWIFLASVLVLALSGFIAAALPARKAIRIEPMQALRNE